MSGVAENEEGQRGFIFLTRTRMGPHRVWISMCIYTNGAGA